MDKNKNQYIVVDDEKLELLQKMSSDFHRVYAEAMQEYGEKELKLIDDVLQFGHRMILVVGIIAGFGFTAIESVKHHYLFISGELLLIGSIVYGVYQIKKIYATNLGGIQDSGDKVSKVFKEKSQLFQNVITKAVAERKINFSDFQKRLNSVDTKLLAQLTPKKVKASKDEGQFLNIIIGLLIFGSIIILLSFMNFSWVAQLINKR